MTTQTLVWVQDDIAHYSSTACHGWADKNTELKLWCFWSAEPGFESWLAGVLCSARKQKTVYLVLTTYVQKNKSLEILTQLVIEAARKQG